MFQTSPTVRTSTLLGLCAGLLPWTAQADFIDDSHLNLGLRNFYLERNFNNSTRDNLGSWSQGFQLQFKSGYTEGPVQFALDATGQYAVRLDSYGSGGDSVLPFHQSTGKAVGQYGSAGLTGKMRYSKTEVSLGEHRPRLPVAFDDDSRQLQTTYQGVMVESKEIDKLTLTGGRFWELKGRESTNSEKIYLWGDKKANASDGLNFAGASYALTPQLTGTYFFGQLEDIYRQHYVGLAHNMPLVDDYSLRTDVRYYNTKDEGRELAGKVDNSNYGAMVTLKKGVQSFGLGYQRQLGDNGFPTFNNYVPQPFLINWSTLAFIKPNEKSVQARYDADFAAWGAPGLKLMTRYIKGSDAKRAGNLDDISELERNFLVSYVVQSGPLKDVGLTWFNIMAKTQSGNQFDENRLIVTYTVSIW